jgi:hypothetical protein
MRRVALEFRPGGGWVALRELRGCDEDSVEETNTEAAIALLDRLLCDSPGAALQPGEAARLTAPDRDRLLADIHRRNIADRIESTLVCSACKAPLDVDFTLTALLESLDRGCARPGDGIYRLADGRAFRLPTGVDELASAWAAPEQAPAVLARACVVEGDPERDPDALAAAMQDTAPLLDLDLDATCTECNAVQSVHFDLQHYMLSRILADRFARALEVHRLARAYGWSLHEILNLPRSQRRIYVELVDRELGGR